MNKKLIAALFTGTIWFATLLGAYLIGRSAMMKKEATATVQVDLTDPVPENLSAPILSVDRLNAGTAANTNRELANSATPGALLQALLESPSELEGTASLIRLLETMSAEDFKLAFEELEGALENNLLSRENYDKVDLLFYAWGKKDGRAAMKYIEAAEGRGMKRFLPYFTVLDAWGKSDPSAAITWAIEKEDSKEEWEKPKRYVVGRENMVTYAIKGVAKNDFLLATQLAKEAKDFNGERALRVIVEEVLKKGNNMVKTWTDSIGDEDKNFRRKAITTAAESLAVKDPQFASSWIIESGNMSASEKRSAIRRLGSMWAYQAPEVALAWAENIDEAVELRSTALSTVKSSIRRAENSRRAQNNAKKQ